MSTIQSITSKVEMVTVGDRNFLVQFLSTGKEIPVCVIFEKKRIVSCVFSANQEGWSPPCMNCTLLGFYQNKLGRCIYAAWKGYLVKEK